MSLTQEHELRLACPVNFSLPDELLVSCRVVCQRMQVADSWYVPVAVANLDAHEQWVAAGGAAPLRIRQCSQGDRISCQLEVKRLGRPGNLSSAEEVAIDCPDPRAAHRFLTAIGFAYVVDVVKIRTAYLHADGVGLSLDDYGSARVLELEIRSRSQSSQAALDYLRGWARSHLGDGLRELDEPHVLGVIRSALRAVGQGR